MPGLFFLVVPVFFPRGQAAADMPLRFIDVQHAAHPHIELGIDHRRRSETSLCTVLLLI